MTQTTPLPAVAPTESTAASTLGIGTLARYLIGDRRAVDTVARAPHAMWIGLLFVLSAGFAREYDGESLLHEPWHALLPLAASLVASMALYGLVTFVWYLRYGRLGRSWAAGYVVFLGLFWMTAPLAWIYALPVERWMAPGDAVRFNLSMLGLVSLWRVLLMARVVSVVFSGSFIAALCVVLLFADVVALIVLWATPLPIFQIMGGIRLSDSETVLQGVAFTVGFFGGVSLFVWLGATTVIAFRPLDPSPTALGPAPPARTGRGLWLLALVSPLAGAAMLPVSQSEQAHRWHVEQRLRHGEIESALAFMSERRRQDFPPHWDPPPRIGYGEHDPSLETVLDAIVTTQTDGWVRDIYVDKLITHASGNARDWPVDIETMEEAALERYVNLLEEAPAGRRAVAAHVDSWRWQRLMESADPQRRALYQRLRALAEQHPPGDDGPAD